MRGCSSSEVGSVRTYWKSDYELGFYSNYLWGCQNRSCFNKTLKSIFVRRSRNYYASAVYYSIYYGISNHCEWEFIGLVMRCHKYWIFTPNVAPLTLLLSPVTFPLLKFTRHSLQRHVVYSPWFSWSYESLFHFCVGGHRFFPRVNVMMNSKLPFIKLYLFLLFCLLFCWRAKTTNTRSSLFRCFHISRKEKYRKLKQVSLRQST